MNQPCGLIWLNIISSITHSLLGLFSECNVLQFRFCLNIIYVCKPELITVSPTYLAMFYSLKYGDWHALSENITTWWNIARHNFQTFCGRIGALLYNNTCSGSVVSRCQDISQSPEWRPLMIISETSIIGLVNPWHFT